MTHVQQPQATSMRRTTFAALEVGELPGRGNRAADSEVRAKAREILELVQAHGDAALRDLTEQFDGVRIEDFRVPEAEINSAYSVVGDEFLGALQSAIAAVRAFHAGHLPSEDVMETAGGVRVWRTWRPLDRVGLYVPGGRARYPSSVVMLAVPAAIGGCAGRVLVTPPDRAGRVPAETLVAAAECGITEIYRVGGAQAIAALAFGTTSIPRVKKIFGPGNAYVTAAKLAVYPEVAIDVPAGPSELMIIADESANPEWIAADLLADAEHGPDSPVLLVTLSGELVEAVSVEIDVQLATLPRAALARQSLDTHGIAIVVDDISQAISVANSYAPEHLQLMTRDAADLVASVTNAGSVFVGPWAPNAAGDYATGTNHVLPTNGYARAYAALSTEAFGRAMQVQELNQAGIQGLARTVAILARSEGLEGHARAVEARLERTASTHGRTGEGSE